MRIKGPTGGISLWKNTISNLFKYHGIPVVDAFLVTRDVLKKGAGGWKKVAAAFGDDHILQADGEVDLPRLGQIVFTVPAKRQLLNRNANLKLDTVVFCSMELTKSKFLRAEENAEAQSEDPKESIPV